jgi:hypothetical protein
MIDLRNVPNEVLERIAKKVEKETDLMILSTKKFLPKDGKINTEIIEKSFRLYDETKTLGKDLPEEQRYCLREEFIKNYIVS